jgi:hypothetical protein
MKRDEYFAKLKQRSITSHVYRKYQLDGLEIAQILGDEKHKSLYIKLAKERNAQELRLLARSVADRTGVKNPGALFMYLLKRETSGKPRSVRTQKSTRKART